MVGQTISHYRVLDKLGEGGMGVVYKAEDTKLERPVALKFPPGHLLGNQDVRRRFEREAKAAAALSHPNVCRVYEIDEVEGKTFLAMELVEGESLDKKIARGPLKLDDALSIAQQVAKGLEAAHKRGIVHRDIKPENIMVGEDGHVTIMDFGLAQLTEASRLTRTDETLGTVAYMSPEQTEGSGTDHRTDIWSLGVVLYEMITGQQPFKGDYDKAVMYSILNEEHEPITAVRAGVPMELEFIIGKCLGKDVGERYATSAEVARDLVRQQKNLAPQRERRSASEDASGPSDSRTRSRARVLRGGREAVGWVCAALLALALVAVSLSPFPETPTQQQIRRFGLRPASLWNNEAGAAVISPNGKHIVYVSAGEQTELWVRDLHMENPRPLSGTEGGTRPFWSPDSEFIGFATESDLKKISVFGGPPITVCPLPVTPYRGGAWSPDGEYIVFSAQIPPRPFRVEAKGGTAELWFDPEGTQRGRGYHYPHFLPREARAPSVLFAVGGGYWRDIVLRDLNSGLTRVLAAGDRPVYSPTGHVLFHSSGASGGIWALPFSIETLKPTGEAFPVAENVGGVSLAEDGTMVYVDLLSAGQQQLVWRDRTGEKLGSIGRPQDRILYPALSPDGKHVAVQGYESQSQDIWVHQTERPVKTRLTTDSGSEGFPVWSPSNERVAYQTGRGAGLFAKTVGRQEAPTKLVQTPPNARPGDWSKDGNHLVYAVPSLENGYDIWFAQRTDGSDFELAPFLSTPFNEVSPKLSPDGRLMAYCSDQSGSYEIYIQRFPDGGEQRQVSTGGGWQPQWSTDELFYVQSETLMAAAITGRSPTTFREPAALFRSSGLVTPLQLQYLYDVTSDGQRFVTIETVQDKRGQERAIHVVLNWYEEFRDREE